MEETLINGNPCETTKIKTNHARIVVDGTAEKPYYSIEWYDHTKNEYFLGYSSYYIGYVYKWLEECFEIVEEPKTNADRIRSMTDEELNHFLNKVSNCLDDCPHQFGYVKALKWLRQPAEPPKEDAL